MGDTMSTTPVVTIFVRHSADCKYAGDEFCKRCNCRKHFRYSLQGKQRREKAGTRSWAEAEEQKRRLEDRLAGRLPAPDSKDRLTVEAAAKTFLQAKRNTGVEELTIDKWQLVLDRLVAFCAADKIIFLDEVDLTHVTTWDWSQYFESTHSLRSNREKVRAFFRYYHDAGVIAKNPTGAWKRVKGRIEQVRGFSPEEFEKILDTVSVVERKITRSSKDAYRKDRHGVIAATPATQKRLRALVLLMRYSGLAIIDAVSLERDNLYQKDRHYRVRLKTRQKVSKRDFLQPIDNAIPDFVGKELVAVLNGNPKYIFWDRKEFVGDDEPKAKRKATAIWHKWIRALLDCAGMPNATGHMFRHTLAIEMIRHGASFEDVAAALGNTVAVVAKFYSHEWSKVRQHRTDAAIKAAW
jgi:site-specific recombinase XerD